MSVLGLRLSLSAAVALTFFVAVRVGDLVRLLVSRVRKAGLLRDAVVLAAATCPSLAARGALQLIEQIAFGLDWTTSFRWLSCTASKRDASTARAPYVVQSSRSVSLQGAGSASGASGKCLQDGHQGWSSLISLTR